MKNAPPKRQERRQNCGGEPLVSRDNDNSSKRNAAPARDKPARHQLAGDLEKDGTRKRSRRNRSHRPAESDRVLDFRRDDLETKHRGKGIGEQRDEKQADRADRKSANVAQDFGRVVVVADKNNDPEQQRDRYGRLEQFAYTSTPQSDCFYPRLIFFWISQFVVSMRQGNGKFCLKGHFIFILEDVPAQASRVTECALTLSVRI